jgi:hypothetical protein
VSPKFGVFKLIWTDTNLTCGIERMTRGNPYMTWPNGRLTCGSTNDSWAIRMLTW